MLIRAIRAENFMRFSRLRIEGLPLRGIIGIEGANEAGKTTIGEALLFAFFGKTSRPDDVPVAQLIRWNQSRLSVEVEFDIQGAGEFLIYREVDKGGTNYVKLLDRRDRTEIAAGHVAVDGWMSRSLRLDHFEFLNSFFLHQHQAVSSNGLDAAFLDRLTGSAQIRRAISGLEAEIVELEREYAHYHNDIQRNQKHLEQCGEALARLPEQRLELESLIRDQRRFDDEAQRLDASARALRGLKDQIEKAAALVEPGGAAKPATLGELSAALEELRSRVGACLAKESASWGPALAADLSAQGHELEAQSQWLSGLTRLRAAIEDRGGFFAERYSDPGAETRRIEEERLEDRCRGLRRVCARESGWALAFLSAGGAAAAAAGFASTEAGAASAALSWLGRLGLAPESAPLALWAAAAPFLGLFAALVVLRAAAGARRRRAEAQLEELRREDREARLEKELVDAALAKAGPGELEALFDAAARSSDSGVLQQHRELARAGKFLSGADAAKELRLRLEKLAGGWRTLRDPIAKALKESERRQQEAGSAAKKRRSERSRLEGEIRNSEGVAAKREEALARGGELGGRASELQQAMELHRVAIQLLDETATRIRERMGPIASKYLQKALPSLTQGRYRDLRVDPCMAMKVFASEKNDFMEVAELSGGTLESLKLALRLAVCQMLAHSRGRSSQFVFLDEPFKMTDPRRTEGILEGLRRLSGELSQVFIVLPGFSPSQRQLLDGVLHLDGGSATLDSRWDAGAPPRGVGSPPAAPGGNGAGAGDEAPGDAGASDELSDRDASSAILRS
jgi:exonuclease SbcC